MYRKKTLFFQGESSNAFPGKSLVQYKLYLIILSPTKIYLSIAGSTLRADRYLTFDQP